MADATDRVVPLDDLDDFKVAEGDPDVRGWEVIASDGRKIGEVDQLLVDTAAMKVRYLDVDLDDDLLDTDEDRHVLIPIGYARLDEEHDRIHVDEMASNQVTGVPVYTHEPLTREYEVTVARSYDPAYTAGGSDLYTHRLYDEDRFYAARRGMDE